jgi:hypothetical protein
MRTFPLYFASRVMNKKVDKLDQLFGPLHNPCNQNVSQYDLQ